MTMAGARRKGAVRTAAAALLAAAALAGCGASAPAHAPGSTPVEPRDHSSVAPSGAASTTAPRHRRPSHPPPSPAQRRRTATAEVAALAAHEPAHSVSVAALNVRTGARFTAGPQSGMWTASAYKLFVLETLLLRAQQADAALSDTEAAEAVPMIEQSNNTDGYGLFLDAGGNAGLSAAAAQFGMRHTVPGATDPTFTTTGALDCLQLLKALVTDGPLDANAQSFTLSLMRDVEADQRWGVGVVADPGSRFANKNGWLSVDNTNGPGEDDDDRWVVTSLGVVRVKGQQVLMAVLTQHQESMAAGVRLVQRLARDIAPVVAH
jgi:hypothetical protein